MSVVKRIAIGLSAAVGIAVAAAPLASAGVPSSGIVYEGDRVCYDFADGLTLGNLWVGPTDCVHYPDAPVYNDHTGGVDAKELGSINLPNGPGVTAAWWF